MDTAYHPATEPRLIRGEFAPVFWEPLGKRGEKLVAGMVLTNSQGIGKAYQTLTHKRLLEFISKGKSDSATGLLKFTFDHLNKTLSAGGAIEDLRVPFASMSLGRTETITARGEQELLNRATKLCTLLGQIPEEDKNKIDPSLATETTNSFIQGVRRHIQEVNSVLAKEAMKRDHFFRWKI